MDSIKKALDRSTGHIPNELYRNVFEHKGYDVLEIIAPWPDAGPSTLKLLWVRRPMEKMVIGDIPSPIFSRNFVQKAPLVAFNPVTKERRPIYRLGNDQEKEAREGVRRAFEDYYGKAKEDQQKMFTTYPENHIIS